MLFRSGPAVWLLGGIGLGVASLAGCVTANQQVAPASAAPSADKVCVELVEARRSVGRRIDDAEAGRAGPSTMAGVFAITSLLSTPFGASVLQDAARAESGRALDELRSTKRDIDREIDERKCTLGAKARAGDVKLAQDARFDGAYAGKGTTESWCQSPIAELSIAGGRISGSVRGQAGSFDATGQVYGDGKFTLLLQRSNVTTRPSTWVIRDDLEGKLDGDMLSFIAGLDTGPKACTYRFALKRGWQLSPLPSRAP